jgi:hypothetical protein
MHVAISNSQTFNFRLDLSSLFNLVWTCAPTTTLNTRMISDAEPPACPIMAALCATEMSAEEERAYRDALAGKTARLRYAPTALPIRND